VKLVVGLGNPGSTYQKTRHNVGFQVLDAFARAHGLSFAEKKAKAKIARGAWPAPEGKLHFLLAKPQTYMNLSGQSVQALLTTYKISIRNVILIFDDLDLDCGRIRLKRQGGSGGHRGVASVIERTGSQDFSRIKVGIGRNPLQDVVAYVLSPFEPEEEEHIRFGIDQAAQAIPYLLEGRMSEAMNHFHRLPKEGRSGGG